MIFICSQYKSRGPFPCANSRMDTRRSEARDSLKSKFNLFSKSYNSKHVCNMYCSRHEYLCQQNKTRVNKAGELIVTSDISRSQQRNLEDCLQKISEMITEASQQKPEPSEEDITLRAHRLEFMKQNIYLKSN